MANHQLNIVTFALPVRQFEIHASVTVNETLPKVNEFVLRLIKVCGGILPEEIALYFGFTGKETRLVLDSLNDQSLIRVDGELIRLTEYAESKFYMDDDIPRFSVVKPRKDIIDFDLLTFHPIDGRVKKRSAAFLVELPCDAERIGSSTRLAEEAYQKHFRKILRDKERTKDDIEIYKISNVKSKKVFEVPIEVRFALSDKREVERVVEYDDDATEEFRLSVEAAVSDALQTSEIDQFRWLCEFIDYFDDPVLKRYLKNSYFDFDGYVREAIDGPSTDYTDGTEPILGNLYMPENQTRVMQMLTVQLLPVHGGINLRSVIWLAPSYRFWGRTTLLDDFYFKIKAALPQPKKERKDAIEHCFLLFPGLPETKWLLERQLWGIRPKDVHFYSGEAFGGLVEIFLFPLGFACVQFHYRPPGNSMALVPIGFMTTNMRLVEKAKALIGISTGYGSQYIGPAIFDRSKPPKHMTFADRFGFLNYSPLPRGTDCPLFGVPSPGHGTPQNGPKSRPVMRASPMTPTNSSHVNRVAGTGDPSNADQARSNGMVMRWNTVETEDQMIFRSGPNGDLVFKISKSIKWRGLMPLRSIEAAAINDLVTRTGANRDQIIRTTKNMSKYVIEMMPAECAKKLSDELKIPASEIWRYFIDAMFILER
jgi:hypothetical protein